MTLDQVLLTGLVLATVAGVVISVLHYRTQAKWRQKDLLREFISKWATEAAVPTEVDAIRFDEEDLRLRAEKDSLFLLAFKLLPKRVQLQYGVYIEARSVYVKACHKLHEQVEAECVERTGLPVGRWGDERNWPEKILLPNFVLSIYEHVLGTKQDTFRPEDVLYNIGLFSHSGQGFERKGLHLTTSYGAYQGLELARADDKTALDSVKSIHRQMIEADYSQKFTVEVAQLQSLRKKAEMLADKVRADLQKF